MNITLAIERNAAAFPLRTALLVDGVPHTYRALWKTVLTTCARLSAAGVRRGDVVAVGLGGNEAFLVSVMALARMGATATSLSLSAIPDRCAEILLRHGTRFILPGEGSTFEHPDVAHIQRLDPRTILAPAGPFEAEAPAAEPDVGALAWWIGTTSGTTGTPKSVARTHAREAVMGAVYPGADHDYYERVCAWLKCDTSFGLSVALRVLQEGTTLVLSSDHSGRSFVTRLTSDRPTCIITSTGAAMQIVQALRRSQRARDLGRSTVKRFVMGGSVASVDLIDGIRELLCEQAEVRYASSESGPLGVLDDEVRRRRPDAHARLFPWVEARALDEDGRVLAPGEVGTLCFRSPFTTDGYVGDPQATERYFRDGWHVPGDRGSVDAGGHLVLAGRSDTLINIGGNKIDAQAIEAVLDTHPAVRESVVLPVEGADGRPIALLAVVAARAAVEPGELQRLCQDRLGPVGTPQRVVFVDALPRNDGGKLMRHVLKSRVQSQLQT